MALAAAFCHALRRLFSGVRLVGDPESGYAAACARSPHRRCPKAEFVLSVLRRTIGRRCGQHAFFHTAAALRVRTEAKERADVRADARTHGNLSGLVAGDFRLVDLVELLLVE